MVAAAKPQAQATSTANPAGPEVYKVGDVISIGDTVMVVLGWDEPAGNQFAKPDAGNKFVAVEIILVNRGNSPSSVSSLLQMALKDDTDQKYSIDLMASAVVSSSLDGELAPGEKVRGRAAFQVPGTAKGLKFVFDATVFGTGKVFVDLGPEPIMLEAPPSIQGEAEQQVYQVGQSVEVENLVLTVNAVTSLTGDQFNKPEPGNVFLVVDLTIENKGKSAEAISSMLQIWLKDVEGRKYTLDLSASVAAGGATPDGELAPGERTRGKVGFQVPESVQGLTLVFDASVFGGGKVFVELSSQ